MNNCALIASKFVTCSIKNSDNKYFKNFLLFLFVKIAFVTNNDTIAVSSTKSLTLLIKACAIWASAIGIFFLLQ